MADQTARKQARYRGDVQGVGFRANAVHEARGLNLQGFVKNEPDGDVLVDVQGSKANVETLLRRINESMASRINDTLTDDRTPTDDLPPFRIRY